MTSLIDGADSNGVDAGGIAISSTRVLLETPIPHSPDIDGTKSSSSLQINQYSDHTQTWIEVSQISWMLASLFLLIKTSLDLQGLGISPNQEPAILVGQHDETLWKARADNSY